MGRVRASGKAGETHLIYYAVVGAATFAMVLAAVRLWTRTGSVAFPVGLFFIYYWTLHGAWSLIADNLAPVNERNYLYLYSKLFPITLDQTYFETLLLYALFCLAVCTMLLIFVPDRPASSGRGPVQVSHTTFIVLSSTAGILSYWIVRDSLDLAFAINQSGYAATRAWGAVGDLFTIHQVLNRVALFPASIGIAIAFSGQKARLISGPLRSWHLAGYAVVLVGMYVFCALLGNKNELFAALLAGALFYLVNRPDARLVPVGLLGAGALAFIAVIDAIRGLPIGQALEELHPMGILSALVGIAASNEAFGPHFSLYGALKFDVPITYGTSLVSLVVSVVPRILWPDRPPDIYPYYASHVGAVQGQGYGLHHVTGWYLNFGIAGVVIGGLVFGGLWAWFYAEAVADRRTNFGARAFFLLAPWTFIAGVPNLIRAGIEGYKGLAVDSLLIPTVAVMAAHLVHRAAHAPRFDGLRGRHASWRQQEPNRMNAAPPGPRPASAMTSRQRTTWS